jgi:uncharacterized protein (TIGR03067 family)
MSRCMLRFVAAVALTVLVASLVHAEVLELEGVVKAVDAADRTLSVERKTPKGNKTLELEVTKKAGDLSAVKIGDRITFSYDPDLELVTKLGEGPAVTPVFDTAAFLKDLEALQGEWSATRSIIGGKEVEPEKLKSQRNRLKITGTTLVFLASLPSRDVQNERAFVIDPERKQITLYWRDGDGQLNQGVGIYSVTGDELRICYAHNSDGKTKRPHEFMSVPGPPPNAFHIYTRSR